MGGPVTVHIRGDHRHPPIYPPQTGDKQPGLGLPGTCAHAIISTASRMPRPQPRPPLSCLGPCLTLAPCKLASKRQPGTWLQILAPAPPSCVALGKLLSLSQPQCPHLYGGVLTSQGYRKGLLWGLNELIGKSGLTLTEDVGVWGTAMVNSPGWGSMANGLQSQESSANLKMSLL